MNDQEQTNNAVTVTLESIYQRVFTLTDFLRRVYLWGAYSLLVPFFAGFTKTKNTHMSHQSQKKFYEQMYNKMD